MCKGSPFSQRAHVAPTLPSAQSNAELATVLEVGDNDDHAMAEWLAERQKSAALGLLWIYVPTILPLLVSPTIIGSPAWLFPMFWPD